MLIDTNDVKLINRNLNLEEIDLSNLNEVDLRGQVFGNLLVQSFSSPVSRLTYKCLCACGNTVNIYASTLLKGERVKCTPGCESVVVDPPKNYYYPFKAKTVKKYLSRAYRKGISKCSYRLRYKLIRAYCDGMSLMEISDKFMVEEKSLDIMLRNIREKLNANRELRALNSIEAFNISKSKAHKLLQTKFTEPEIGKKISLPDDKDLTNEEMLYGIILVKTGSNPIALQESGLMDCLKVKDSARKRLFGMYLQSKDNLSKFIQSLKNNKILEADVSKSTIQAELIDQISQLKESIELDATPTHRAQLIKSIELLGRTVAAFQDNIKITEVNPADALNQLIDMAKVESTYSIEDLEEDN